MENTETAVAVVNEAPVVRKQCRDCGQSFPDSLEYFHRRSGNRTNSYCKPCANSRSATHHRVNHERHLATMSAYRDLHRDELRAYWRDYGMVNADKRKQQGKARYWGKRDELLSSSHKYYSAHKRKYVERARQWAENNPEKANAHNLKKRLRRRGATPNAEAMSYVRLISADACCYCGQLADSMEIDHIVPLCAGGDSSWDNLTRACRSCNAAKAGKTLLDFLYRRMEMSHE